MAEKTAVKTGKATEAATWSNGKAVETGDDCVVPTGFTVEQNSAVKARSWRVTGTGALSGSTTMNVGASTAGPSNVLVSFASTATITWTGALKPETTAAGAQTVALGGHTLAGLFEPAGEGVKIQLLEDLLTTGNVKWTVGVGANVLDLNGHTIQGSNVMLTAPEVLATNAKIAASGSGAEKAEVSATVVGSASCTLELNNTGASERQLVTGSKTWGKLVVAGNVRIADSPTVETEFAFNSKGAAATKGTRIATGALVTLVAGAVLTSNGTEAEPARLESSEAGKRGSVKVRATQELTSWAKIKDIKVEEGPLYVPHGTDEGNNLTVGTTIKFEAKPGETVQVVGTAKAKSVSVGALSPLMEATGTTKARATGALLTATILNAAGATQARFRTVGAASALQGLTGASKARSQAAGASTHTQGVTGATRARTVAHLSLTAGGLIQIEGTTRATSSAQLSLAASKPHFPGISSPSQRLALSAPRQRAGVSSPTQRTGDA